MSNAVAEKPEKLTRKKPMRAADLKKEFDSRDVKIDQKAPIDMGDDLTQPVERTPISSSRKTT